LERFLHIIINAASYDPALAAVIKEAVRVEVCGGNAIKSLKQYNLLFKKPYPAMSKLHRVLQNSAAQEAIWRVLKLTAPLPFFTTRHWIGNLSGPEATHHPDFVELYVAEDDLSSKAFFMDLIDQRVLPGSKILEYNECYATAAQTVRSSAPSVLPIGLHALHNLSKEVA
jgi:hypothetical protein